MLRIQDVSDWAGGRVRLATDVPALGDAAYVEALKMGLDPRVTVRRNGFRALEFVGSHTETAELLAELPAGLLEEASAERQRAQAAPKLSRAQEWERAARLVSECLALQEQQAHRYADYVEQQVQEQSAERGEVEPSNWENSRWEGGAA